MVEDAQNKRISFTTATMFHAEIQSVTSPPACRRAKFTIIVRNDLDVVCDTSAFWSSPFRCHLVRKNYPTN